MSLYSNLCPNWRDDKWWDVDLSVIGIYPSFFSHRSDDSYPQKRVVDIILSDGVTKDSSVWNRDHCHLKDRKFKILIFCASESLYLLCKANISCAVRKYVSSARFFSSYCLWISRHATCGMSSERLIHDSRISRASCLSFDVIKTDEIVKSKTSPDDVFVSANTFY